MKARRRGLAASAARFALAGALLVLLLVAGCGGGGGEKEGASAAAESTGQSGPPSGEKSIEGFGQEAAGEDREEILAVFDGYLKALAKRDYVEACADLSQDVHRSLAQIAGDRQVPCPQVLPALLAPRAAALARQQAEGQIAKVRFEDEQAFVVFEAPGAELYQLTMVAEEGEWKAASVAAAVLVPEP